MIEERFARIIPIASVAVALLTGGAWLSVHAGPGDQPSSSQQPPPPEEPASKNTGCDCSDCGDCDLSACDVSGCDVSGLDISCALPMTHIRMLRGTSWLALLLPLALLDAWRRRIARQELTDNPARSS